MTVVLFDIDGTLVLTGRAGQYAMHTIAAEDAFVPVDDAAALPGPPPNSEISFAGRTDRSIIQEFLRRRGLDDSESQQAEFRRRFLNELPQQLRQRQGVVLPGVVATLERLSFLSPQRLGLLTGNLRRAARMKLSHYGLDKHFYGAGEALGAFGDDHIDRDDVARDALRDVRRRLGDGVREDDIWIVGDTPLDVRCARAIGARVVAVATGEFSEEDLRATGADLVLPDLTHSQAWCETLISTGRS